MTDFSNVRDGDDVTIVLMSDSTKEKKGEVSKVLSKDTEKTIVVLTDGDKGRVIQINNSTDQIIKRIMTEDQHTENKEIFNEPVMRHDVIPKTIQSFLNSEGGYLYIGIKDMGTLKERLVGLDEDMKLIDKDSNKTKDKQCDDLERRIMDSIEKHLDSRESIGSLIEIKFPIIHNVQIVEIAIKQSPRPWFFKHGKNNRPEEFELRLRGEIVRKQRIDSFYIRRGGSKKLLETYREFYDYTTAHFTN